MLADKNSKLIYLNTKELQINKNFMCFFSGRGGNNWPEKKGDDDNKEIEKNNENEEYEEYYWDWINALEENDLEAKASEETTLNEIIINNTNNLQVDTTISDTVVSDIVVSDVVPIYRPPTPSSSILNNIIQFCYDHPIGISITTFTIVGLGAGFYWTYNNSEISFFSILIRLRDRVMNLMGLYTQSQFVQIMDQNIENNQQILQSIQSLQVDMEEIKNQNNQQTFQTMQGEIREIRQATQPTWVGSITNGFWTVWAIIMGAGMINTSRAKIIAFILRLLRGRK